MTFSIDANGIVNVSAKDLGTGRHQESTLTQSSNMSSAEIDQAIRDAERYAAEDALRRKSAELAKPRGGAALPGQVRPEEAGSGGPRAHRDAAQAREGGAGPEGRPCALEDAIADLTQALQAVGRFTDDSASSSEDGAMDASFTSGESGSSQN